MVTSLTFVTQESIQLIESFRGLTSVGPPIASFRKGLLGTGLHCVHYKAMNTASIPSAFSTTIGLAAPVDVGSAVLSVLLTASPSSVGASVIVRSVEGFSVGVAQLGESLVSM